ncbi:MAG: hypothetical protein WCG97_02975 [bacterium]
MPQQGVSVGDLRRVNHLMFKVLFMQNIGILSMVLWFGAFQNRAGFYGAVNEKAHLISGSIAGVLFCIIVTIIMCSIQWRTNRTSTPLELKNTEAYYKEAGRRTARWVFYIGLLAPAVLFVLVIMFLIWACGKSAR